MKNRDWQVHNGRCDYCHSIIDDDPLMKAGHTRWHKKCQRVEAELGYLPANYHERESTKRAASMRMQNEATAEAKVKEAMTCLRCFFDGSLENAINRNYWDKHPKLEEYVAMFEPAPNVIPEDLMTKIRDQYGRIEGEIAEGHTDWRPPRSKERKLQFKTMFRKEPDGIKGDGIELVTG